MGYVFFEQNTYIFQTRKSIDSSVPRFFSSLKIISKYFRDDFVQLRSKKEVEALLQGTLGNNNAYLEKK